MTDISNPADVRKMERAAKVRLSALDKMTQAIMGMPQGRAWVWHFLSQTHMFASAFDPNPTTMAFKVGEQNVGLQMMATIQAACPELYLQMTKENSNAGRRNPQPDSRAGGQPGESYTRSVEPESDTGDDPASGLEDSRPDGSETD